MKMKALPLPGPYDGPVTSQVYLNLEFLRRLKAYAAFYKVSITGSGFRSVYDQASAWIRYQNDPTGHPAAYPGESWHNCGLAYDVGKLATGKYPATMEDDYQHKPPEQAMAAFGLCLPMWAGTSQKEPWHVQPIETLGIAGPDRQWFLDADDKLKSDSGFRVLRLIKLDSPVFTRSALMRGSDVKVLQGLLKIEADGWFGPLTDQAVNAFQASHELTVDGIVGPATWAALMVPDYQVLYEKALAAQGEMKRSISVKIQALDDIIQSIRGDLT